MNNELENELKKALKYISADWKMQNNYQDYRSNFIYKVKTVDECVQLAKENNIDISYVLHRWYNFNTSIYCESLFVEYGAVKEKNFRKYISGTFIKECPAY